MTPNEEKYKGCMTFAGCTHFVNKYWDIVGLWADIVFYGRIFNDY